MCAYSYRGLAMASEWREVQLGDVAILTTGFPFKSQHYTSELDAPRLIGGDNIVQGQLRWESVRRWPRDMTTGLDDYWLEPGDVVLAMDRPWIEAGLKRAFIGSKSTNHDLNSARAMASRLVASARLWSMRSSREPNASAIFCCSSIDGRGNRNERICFGLIWGTAVPVCTLKTYSVNAWLPIT